MIAHTQRTRYTIMHLLALISCFALIAAQSTESQLPPPLGQLVPRIEQENFKLLPEGNQYKLTIDVPYGNRREETVTLLNNNELSVKGELSFAFGGYTYNAVYVADSNGYRVRYVLEPLKISLTASAALLKSAAG